MARLFLALLLLMQPAFGEVVVTNPSTLNILTDCSVPIYPANATAALAACANQLGNSGGGNLMVPVAAFLIDPIQLPGHVIIEGMMRGPFNGAANPATTVNAPTFIINSHGSPAITLGSAGGVRNMLFYDPNQVAPTAATPTVTPAFIQQTFNSNLGSCVIENNTLVNAYVGINVGEGMCYIRNNVIGSYSSAITVDGAENFVMVEGNITQPLYDSYLGLTFPQTIDTWVLNNGWAMILGRVDQLSATNNGFFGKYGCIEGIDSTVGATSPTAGYGTIVNQSCDNVAYGVYVKSDNSSAYGYQLENVAITSNVSGVGTAGQAAFATVTGGTNTPYIRVNQGFVNGTWSATRAISAAAGQIWVQNVHGINPVGLITAPTVPATNTGYTNNFSVPVRVHVVPNGATITAIGINGTPTGLLTGTFLLRPYDIITLVYTGGTPSWTWFGE